MIPTVFGHPASAVLALSFSDLSERHVVIALAVSTLLFAAAIFVIWRVRRAVLEWIDRQTLAWTRRIESYRLRRVGLTRIRQAARILVRLVGGAALFAAGIVWLTFVLELFAATREWGDQLAETILREFASVARSAVAAVPGIGVVAALFFVVRIIHELLNHYFVAIEEGEVKSEVFDEVTAEITRRLAGVGLWLAALIIAYPYIPGSDSAAFKGISLLAGLMVSLGSTNLVGQLVNGLMIIYSHAVRPGDFIETGQIEGTIERLGLFSCSLRTAQEELVVLPNSTLAAGLKNFSRPREGKAVCLVTAVTIGYDAPWRQVHQLLLAAAGEVTAIRSEPAPFVRQAALDDFYVKYELVFAPGDPAQRRVLLSALHAAIQDRFHAAGVQIMSPHYLGDPPVPKIPPAP